MSFGRRNGTNREKKRENVKFEIKKQERLHSFASKRRENVGLVVEEIRSNFTL